MHILESEIENSHAVQKHLSLSSRFQEFSLIKQHMALSASIEMCVEKVFRLKPPTLAMRFNFILFLKRILPLEKSFNWMRASEHRLWVKFSCSSHHASDEHKNKKYAIATWSHRPQFKSTFLFSKLTSSIPVQCHMSPSEKWIWVKN